MVIGGVAVQILDGYPSDVNDQGQIVCPVSARSGVLVMESGIFHTAVVTGVKTPEPLLRNSESLAPLLFEINKSSDPLFSKSAHAAATGFTRFAPTVPVARPNEPCALLVNSVETPLLRRGTKTSIQPSLLASPQTTDCEPPLVLNGWPAILVNAGAAPNATDPPNMTRTGSIVSSAGNGNACVWADYDRDGFVDLYVANSDGSNFLFHNNTNGTFTRITTGAMVVSTANSQGCAWIDYDNDGYPDLFVTRSQSPNMLFHNNRNGTFTKITTGALATEGGTTGGFAWGDYDNDGWPDAFVTGATNSLFHNNGDGTFTKVPPPTGTESGSFLCANWVDFDNDGWLDLFVVDFQVGATCRMYRNNGNGTFTRATGSALLTEPGRWFASAWADIDRDGFPDVVVSNVGVGNILFHNDGNTNHWLTVHCLGRISNRAAIGAKVRVRASIGGKAFWQMREISAGGNIGSQNQLDPMFGLAEAATVETLRVEWPSGIVQEIHNVAANQILDVKEPSRLETMKDGQAVFKLVGGRNVVYNIERSADLETWTRWLTLTNTTGQTTFSDDASIDIQAYRAVEP